MNNCAATSAARDGSSRGNLVLAWAQAFISIGTNVNILIVDDDHGNLNALKAHQVLGCRGVSRTDFRWDEARGLDGLILLEVNTQPGMTPTSLVPEQAEYAGFSFQDFCMWIVKDASCDR